MSSSVNADALPRVHACTETAWVYGQDAILSALKYFVFPTSISRPTKKTRERRNVSVRIQLVGLLRPRIQFTSSRETNKSRQKESFFFAYL